MDKEDEQYWKFAVVWWFVLTLIGVLLVLSAGCNAVPIAPQSCDAPDAGSDQTTPCGPSAPKGSDCPWECFYSSERGYEWQTTCSICGACGEMPQVNEPCAWRCTFDPRAGGQYHWEELYQGCSKGE